MLQLELAVNLKGTFGFCSQSLLRFRAFEPTFDFGRGEVTPPHFTVSKFDAHHKLLYAGEWREMRTSRSIGRL